LRIALFFLFYSVISYSLVGQVPVANFSASAVSGCSPVVVTFTDQSTGSPKFWNWDFGNGQLSNLQNPTIAFYTPGTYTITLVVKNSDGVDGITKTDYISVNPSPTAGFTASSTLACAPTTIQFTDNSVANAGTIVQWKWTFSDGTTYNTQNVSKQFTTPGFYDVSLTVKSSTGCQTSAGANRYIRIVAGLNVNFVNTDPVTCRAPFPVNFTNQTSGPGTISYNWDFGNAATSTITDPSTVYNTAGTYTVKLTAQSSLGCQDNIQKTITIAGKNTSFNRPDSICLNTPANFQNTSTPSPASVLWDFGDGTQSNQLNPSKGYGVPGIYNVKLYSTFSNCTDSVNKNIKVLGKPVVDFTATKTGACSVPVLVNFQNTSSDAVTSTWDFGDGSPPSSAPSHTYNANGVYDVTLTITDSKGCQNTITKPGFIEISAPVINFTNTPAGGCGPIFSFTPNAIINTSDGVASYAWDFGDGTPVNTSATPTHTYTNFGSYNLKLTITTNGGCTSTLIAGGAVNVGSGVAVDFSKSAGVACNSSGVTFTNLSTPAGTAPATQWIWNFGDGDTSHLKNPFHKYSDTGYYSVTLTVITNGCTSTLTKNNFVLSSPPVAAFTDTLDCANKRTVKFTDKSKNNGPLTYKWIFGDATIPNSTLANNTVTYPGAGPYTVKLIVTNGICIDTATKILNLITEQANFSVNKINACQRDSIHFKSLNTPAYIKNYSWTVNGINAGKNSEKFDTSFATFSVYNIALTITDINGCTSTKNTTVNITGPTASFNITNKGGCINSPIVFSDASLPAGAIKKWTWNFGDGTIQNYTASPFTHVYNDTGSYNIKLIVTDTIGCTDTAIVVSGARINRVKAAFSADKTIICPGIALQFTDSSYDKNSYTYSWNFGDGNTSSLQNPSYQYAGNDSTYTVKLVIRDTVGCSDSLIRNNYIKILSPKAAFTIKDSTTICPPLETKFFFKGKDYESFIWDFGDGGSSVLTTPTHFYNDYGKYTVKLYVTGYGGCIDSASSIVNVYNPYGQSSIGYPDTTVCNSLLVNFTLKTPPSTRFYFYFGDGTLDTSQNLTPQHFYGIPSYYSPSLLLLDSQACQVGVGGPYQIRILGALPLFSKDRKQFCDSGIVYFTNYTIANDPIVSQTWAFGDGNTVITKDAFNFYNQPGLYIPKLTVSTQYGCTNTTSDTIRVFGTPHPVILSDDAVCKDLIVNFNGNLQVPDTAIVWKWDFGNGQTSDQQNAQIRYATPGTYPVKLKTSNSLGCSDTTSKKIIINPLPVITLTADTSIIVGTGITIPLMYSPNIVSFNWAPPYNLSCTNCANPIANPKFTTTYKVSVTDENGCISSKNITVLVLCNDKNFFIPNTFSPNGDGNNDWFYPRGKGLDRIEGMRIFNRWGEMVYEKKNFPANDYQSGWNGLSKGKPAPVDTYIYLINIICENAAIITYKGNVTLIR
jgi:gliding motility-associated-like protein